MINLGVYVQVYLNFQARGIQDAILINNWRTQTAGPSISMCPVCYSTIPFYPREFATDTLIDSVRGIHGLTVCLCQPSRSTTGLIQLGKGLSAKASTMTWGRPQRRGFVRVSVCVCVCAARPVRVDGPNKTRFHGQTLFWTIHQAFLGRHPSFNVCKMLI